MKAGFATYNITPRVGVSMAGFGPFLNRNATEVRDILEARAAAFEEKGGKAVFISCDLCTIDVDSCRRAREIIAEAIPELSPENIVVSATHTHSAPAVVLNNLGWGTPDLPYLQILPYKIAQAGINAWNRREEATVSTAAVPCRRIGYNRVYDGPTPRLDQVLREDWEPEKPELTDTTCQVIRFDGNDGALKGFMAYFGCHPVTCSAPCRHLHGDYPGVAIHNLMREFPGSVGLFLQGADGDVNSGCVHQPEPEALLALDVFAGRFANAVRNGLRQARPIQIDEIKCTSLRVDFSTRGEYTEEWLLQRKQEIDAVLNRPEASDEEKEVRMNTIFRFSVEKMLKHLRSGARPVISADLSGVKIGPLEFLCTPFEVMQAIKNDVTASASASIPLVMSLCNGALGYAADQKSLDKNDGYAERTIPLLQGRMPYSDIHRELVQALLEIDRRLN